MKNNFLLTLFTFCIMWCILTSGIYTFKHLIKSVLEELDDHYKSAYCQVDSDSPFQYDFKIEEL